MNYLRVFALMHVGAALLADVDAEDDDHGEQGEGEKYCHECSFC